MNETKEVIWNILRIDSDQKVIVKFTNGTLENEVWYKWEGDLTAIRRRIQNDAVGYRDIWWKEHPLSETEKNQILSMTGSSADIIPETIDNSIPNVVQISI